MTAAKRGQLDNREDRMGIKVGSKIRHTVTNEEGLVVGVSDNTRDCVLVRFGNSFDYLVERAKLQAVERHAAAPPSKAMNSRLLIQ
jgi:hypothetical protein